MLRQCLLIVPLTLHTLAVFSICHLLYLQFRQDPLGRRSWGGWAWRALNVVFGIFYFFYLWEYLAYLLSYGNPGPTPVPLVCVYSVSAASIGALLMQVAYASESQRLRECRFWKTITLAIWSVTLPVMLVRGLQYAGILDYTRASRIVTPIEDGLLAAGVVFGCAMSVRPGVKNTRTFKSRQVLCYFALALVVLGFLVTKLFWYPLYFHQLVIRFLPLIFLFVTTYYGERQVFFDLWAKRGLFFLFSLVAAVTCSAFLLRLFVIPGHWVFGAWFLALPVLPLILAAPWFYSWLDRWVDHAWLGRRFTPAEASDYFAAEVRDAVTERELLESAEASLSHIFRSLACIETGEVALPPPASVELVARFKGRCSGVIRVLPRRDEVPFLSEDQALLARLARSLEALLENQRLRDENARRVRREQELQLNATQSELKALRAQINPHFLFNALGAIAGLIPRDPARAEQTVEQLAEIFRYTLRRSEREWVLLADELEFVESYLYVERARFGSRLCVMIEVEDAVKNVRIPAMVLQTLVENAIKHGVASVRGEGLVHISTRQHGERIVITVADNGPGFPPSLQPESMPGTSGYGLKNIQNRLRGYYGEQACLTLGRDTVAGTTLVSMEFPAVPVKTGQTARRS